MFSAVLLPLTGFIREILTFVPVLIAAVVVAVLVRVVLWVLDLVFDQIDRGDGPILHRSHRLLIALRHVVRPVIIVAAVLFILSYIPGLSTRFVDYTAAGLLALVIASFWRPFESIVADVILSYFRPFKPGDRVCLGEIAGEVTQQTVFFVKLRDERGQEHIIPNRLFLTSVFTLNKKET